MEKIKKYIYLMPAVIFISLFFIYGFVYGLLQSFGLNNIMGESGFTLGYYEKVLKSEKFMDSLSFTAKMALASSSLSLIISIVLLFFLYLNLEGRYLKVGYVRRIIESPLLVPYLVASYLILILFLQSGFISRIMVAAGIIESYMEFPIITNDEKGRGIMLAYIWKTCPFIVMMSFPVLQRINRKWDSVAYIFGVGRVRFFFEVVLPLLAPSLIISFFIIISYMFTAFETPYILGVTYPKALAVMAYDIYSKGNLSERPNLMVINMFISVISITGGAIVYCIYKFVIGKNQRAWD
ncbi:ABC transporter permease subunit [uncultured Ilyobacter sp.]|uniref:ABC transporter permease subunit n=1 Tax=uncultured Ilyobacter sp. TaxID=544433 RepID=UPI0037498DCD